MDIIMNKGVDAGKLPTPERPVEPPKEVKEMTFDISTMPGVKDPTTIKVDGQEVQQTKPEIIKEAPSKKEEPVLKAPKEEPKVKEPKKEEPKKEPEQKKEPDTKVSPVLKAPEGAKKEEPKVEEKKEGVTQITPVKDHKDDFDYTPFAPQEVLNLKNMSRQSREWAASLLKSNKELSGTKDSLYLQHEEGYILSPEYRQLQTREFLARTEGQAWEQALLNIKAGKPFQDIIGFDEKTGQPKFSDARNPSDQDEIRISNNLQKCINVIGQYQGVLQQYPQRYKSQLGLDLQAIEQTRKERFAWVADPKLLDYSVNVEGQGEKKLKDVITDFKNMIPGYLQSNPMTTVAADMFVALIIQGAELREARNGRTIAETEKKEISRGEPSSDATPTEITGKIKVNGQEIPSTFNLEGMPKR